MLSVSCLSTERVQPLIRLKKKKVAASRHLARSLARPLALSLAATVSCLVCSESSGTPPGKMRGLITVKLANEQVNYRSKFLYKKCHFAERCSSSPPSTPPTRSALKERAQKERKGGMERGWREQTNGFLSLFSPLLLLLLLLLLSRKHRFLLLSAQKSSVSA